MITVSNSQNTTTGISLLSPNHFMYYNRNTVSKPKQFVFFVFKKKKKEKKMKKSCFFFLLLFPCCLSFFFSFFFFFLREILFYFLLLLRIIIYVNSKGLKSCTPVSCSFWM